ncbi:hypothetical protein DPMN_007197 [Dreissena polymorpha]|uniref:Uncharacterized protein n=1 Tax=Dreissena polymorpha TaxID=45954 RepID=A0A9D4RY63_DREPO|nr:hypothetical protein DPMN_007197 [Dreissena polymorpha]
MLCPRLKKLKCALVVSAAFCVLIGPYQWLKGSTIDDRIYYDEPVKLHFGDKKDSTLHLTDPLLNQELQSFKCVRLFQNDSVEMAKAATFLSNLNYSFSRRQDEEFLELASNCDQFKKDWGFFVYPPSQEETSFPIAFSILFHENVEQLTRLLRAIYRPQNQYCIHIDGKAPGSIIEIVTRISSCFPNVFIASKLEIVIYASATRLDG